MVIEQFNVQPLMPNSSIMLGGVGVVLIVVGVALALVAASSRLIQLSSIADRINASFGVSKDTGNKYVWVFLGILLIITGGMIVCAMTSLSLPSVVTVGDGYINVESTSFNSVGCLLGISSSKYVASEEIAAAFVSQVGSGDFALHRYLGLDSGDTNVGIFTLGNGATAYLATTNATCLIIELKNGEYLIVGTSDTQTLANSFSQNVHPLTP